MKRWTLLAGLCSSITTAQAQGGWLPLSREVERPYATAMEAYRSGVHTSIRPYRTADARSALGADTLRPTAALPILDRWAGANNGREFKWGPLVDATAGFEPQMKERFLYRGGAGLWTDWDAHPKLSFHLDARVWGERFASYLDTLVNATQVTPGEGYAYGDAPDHTHFDWNGHVSWDPGKYFNLTLGKGRNFFGEGYRSLFLSDEAYSYPYLRITTTAWHIKYVNLFTVMNDIRGAEGDIGDFRRKYASMHYLSWNVSQRVNIGVFEAIVWQQGDSLYPRGFDLNYINPILFYRPVEFNIGSPDNALLGAAINMKVGRHTLLYSQLMLDEFLLTAVREGKGWYANKQAVQLGVVARDAFKVPGLVVRGEWNFIRPFMYTHSDTRQNYAHMGQPLAHPFGANCNELVLRTELTRERWLYAANLSMAWMGSDSTDSYGNNIFRPETDRPNKPDGSEVSYGYHVGQVRQVSLFHGQLRWGYLLDPSTGTRLEATFLLRSRTPSTVDQGTTAVFQLGLMCYFRDRHIEQETRYVLD